MGGAGSQEAQEPWITTTARSNNKNKNNENKNNKHRNNKNNNNK